MQSNKRERGCWMWTLELGPTTKCMWSYVTLFFRCPIKKQDIGKLLCEKDLALCAELTNMQKPRPDSHFKKELAEWLTPFWKWGRSGMPSHPGTLALYRTQNACVNEATKRTMGHRRKGVPAGLASIFKPEAQCQLRNTHTNTLFNSSSTARQVK